MNGTMSGLSQWVGHIGINGHIWVWITTTIPRASGLDYSRASRIGRIPGTMGWWVRPVSPCHSRVRPTSVVIWVKRASPLIGHPYFPHMLIARLGRAASCIYSIYVSNSCEKLVKVLGAKPHL